MKAAEEHEIQLCHCKEIVNWLDHIHSDLGIVVWEAEHTKDDPEAHPPDVYLGIVRFRNESLRQITPSGHDWYWQTLVEGLSLDEQRRFVRVWLRVIGGVKER